MSTTQQWVALFLPVATFAAGLVASPLLEVWRASRQSEEKRQATLARSNRKVLAEIQETLYRFGRGAGRACHEDIMAFRTTGKRAAPLSELADSEWFEAGQRLAILEGRVLDDDLRGLMAHMRALDMDTNIASEQDCISRMGELMSRWEAVVDRTGALYRQTF